MPALRTRCDAMRYYLTGAGSDGGAQTDSSACLGGFRSSSEALTYGISLGNALANISVDYASGGCAPGVGILTCVDTNDVAFQDSLGGMGNSLYLPTNGSTGIAETADTPGSYVRVTRTNAAAISGGPCTVNLALLQDNLFGFTDVSSGQAASGENEYRCFLAKNEATGSVLSYNLWVATLGSQQVANATVLGASGAGSIGTAGSFATWPSSGWINIKDSSGTLKEITYYASRTNSTLTVSAPVRGLLGTTATIGAAGDLLDAVPGIAIAKDTHGVQAAASSFLTIANVNTPPAGVTWKTGITQATGLVIGTLTTTQQIAIWVWRQIPPGAVSNPNQQSFLNVSFDAA